MKLEKIVDIFFVGIIGLSIYVYPIDIKKETEAKEIIERHYDWNFPIQPYEVSVNRLFGLEGMYLPPNLLFVKDENKKIDIRIHEGLHMRHFYTDFGSMFNRTAEENRTELEQYKIMQELK